jgi:tRNA threonylcarbamoyladenosine biosynthesis protein TsaB
LIEELLDEAGLAWGDLSAIGVGTGPGNFTGVRISVATARGLALSLDVPAIGVSRFEAIAHGLPRPLAVVEDARRGEVYVQEFTPEPGSARICDSAALAVEIGDIPLAGSLATEAAALTGAAVLIPRYPLVEAIARLAAQRVGTAQPRPAPFYLRGADAAPPSDPPPVILDA